MFSQEFARLKAKGKQLGSDTYRELQQEDSSSSISLSTHQQENT